MNYKNMVWIPANPNGGECARKYHEITQQYNEAKDNNASDDVLKELTLKCCEAYVNMIHERNEAYV